MRTYNKYTAAEDTLIAFVCVKNDDKFPEGRRVVAESKHPDRFKISCACGGVTGVDGARGHKHISWSVCTKCGAEVSK